MKRKSSYKSTGARLIALLAIYGGMGLTQARAESDYTVYTLESLGGTSSGGNSINDRGIIAGYSNVSDNMSRHATVWRNGMDHRLIDLGTLGGPNSSVPWPNKNSKGIIVGISQTATPDTSGEIFSSGYFYPGPNNTGFVNLAFAWQNGQMWNALDSMGGPGAIQVPRSGSGGVPGSRVNMLPLSDLPP